MNRDKNFGSHFESWITNLFCFSATLIELFHEFTSSETEKLFSFWRRRVSVSGKHSYWRKKEGTWKVKEILESGTIVSWCTRATCGYKREESLELYTIKNPDWRKTQRARTSLQPQLWSLQSSPSSSACLSSLHKVGRPTTNLTLIWTLRIIRSVRLVETDGTWHCDRWQ